MGILHQTESSLTACSSLVTVWCMSQTSRDRNNSRRTHEKNSGETVRRLGTIIQSIFCAQSGADIRLKFWKWLGESRYPGAFSPVLENFRRALSSDPTDCPWVSEDGLVLVRRFPSPSQSIHFGDVSEANRRETPRQKQNAHACVAF